MHGARITCCTPTHDGRRRVADQPLLRSPQRVDILPAIEGGTGRRHDDDQAVQGNPGGGPGRGLQRIGRRDDEQPAVVGAELLQAGHEEAHFALAAAIAQQFGQRAAWPAGIRQLRVELGKTAAHRRQRSVGKVPAAPEIGSRQNFIQGKHVHLKNSVSTTKITKNTKPKKFELKPSDTRRMKRVSILLPFFVFFVPFVVNCVQ